MVLAGVLGPRSAAHWLTFCVLAVLAQACASVATQRPAEVRFASLDSASGGAPAQLDGYLYRPQGAGAHPALVFLHGCGGLTTNGRINSRESDWATRLVRLGYVVLLVDSFAPRSHGEMCSHEGFDRSLYLQRPKDAYAALRYLQSQPFVEPDRVGLIGWSQGGGVVLLGIRAQSLGRPPVMTGPDFKVAVAFYPASCRDQAHRVPWTSAIPLLVLLGDRDNWTLPGPCEAFVEGAIDRGSQIQMRVYPGANHDFDWPNLTERELKAYRTSAGTVPIVGTDANARADALERVPEFLDAYLRP
jgi:dienelactone hydrolase